MVLFEPWTRHVCCRLQPKSSLLTYLMLLAWRDIKGIECGSHDVRIMTSRHIDLSCPVPTPGHSRWLTTCSLMFPPDCRYWLPYVLLHPCPWPPSFVALSYSPTNRVSSQSISSTTSLQLSQSFSHLPWRLRYIQLILLYLPQFLFCFALKLSSARLTLSCSQYIF